MKNVCTICEKEIDGWVCKNKWCVKIHAARFICEGGYRIMKIDVGVTR